MLKDQQLSWEMCNIISLLVIVKVLTKEQYINDQQLFNKLLQVDMRKAIYEHTCKQQTLLMIKKQF